MVDLVDIYKLVCMDSDVIVVVNFVPGPDAVEVISAWAEIGSDVKIPGLKGEPRCYIPGVVILIVHVLLF